MVSEGSKTKMDYFVGFINGINRADGIRDAVDVVEKLNEILNRKQIETDITVGAQQKKNEILDGKQKEIDTIVREQKELVDSIRAKVNGTATVDTKSKADALGNAVKKRIAEAREQGKEINSVVIDDEKITTGYSEKKSKSNDREIGD